MKGRLRPWFALAMAGTLAVACSADPTGLDHVDDEIETVELVMNSHVVASYDAESGTWTGQLDVGAGMETAHVDVVFLNHEGEEIVFDSDHYMEVEVGEETIAEFEQDTPGEFGGHLHGIAPGQTTVAFLLTHGAFPTGHEDWRTTPGVTANVN